MSFYFKQHFLPNCSTVSSFEMTLKFKLQNKTKTKAIFKRESNMHSKLTFKKFKTKSS